MTRRSSVAVGHLRHPDRSGATLCGADPTKIVGCPDCAARREILLRVHVQSLRKPDRSFCGMPIRSGSGSSGGDPDLAYVSVVVATRLSRDGSVDVCPGCRENMARYEVAVARRRSLSSGSAGSGSVEISAESSSPLPADAALPRARIVKRSRGRREVVADLPCALPVSSPAREDDVE